MYSAARESDLSFEVFNERRNCTARSPSAQAITFKRKMGCILNFPLFHQRKGSPEPTNAPFTASKDLKYPNYYNDKHN